MLERFTTADGLAGYRSPLLEEHGVPHAFSTRLAGSGELDAGVLDEVTCARLAALAGVSGVRVRGLRQVHGDRVVEAGAGPAPGEEDGQPLPEADALVTGLPSELLAVRVADCVPVLLADEHGRRVAAAHAGWRGIVAGVLASAIRSLRGDDGPAPRFVAAVGPCIGPERFEVGPEVAEAFVAAGLAPAVLEGRGPRPHVDLRLACELQLLAAGALAVEGTDRCSWDCTWEGTPEFFSHRRDVTHGGRSRTGRMAAVIATAR